MDKETEICYFCNYWNGCDNLIVVLNYKIKFGYFGCYCCKSCRFESEARDLQGFDNKLLFLKNSKCSKFYKRIEECNNHN